MRSLLLAAVAALSFAPALIRAHAASPSTLSIGLAEDPDILDPTLAQSYVGRIVFASLCDKLVDIDAKLNIVPQLATSWQWTSDRTLIMHLRPGVLFQDGTKLDANAVKISLERHLTMPGSARRAEISSLDHVEVINPTTVKLVLKSPSAPFLAALTDRAGMILSPRAIAAEGKNFGLHPVCAGPFSFKERVAQDRIVLDRFKGYWDAKNIHFDRVVFHPILDPSVRLANLQAGAIQMGERMLPSDIPAMRKDKHLRVILADGLGYNGITINVGNGKGAKTPFGQDARIRKAFELAIDRNALVKVVFNGLFPAVAQGLTPASPFYDTAVKPQPRDIAMAKTLLHQAGVKGPVAVTLTTTNDPVARQIGEIIQSMTKAAGFKVTLRATEFGTALAAARHGDFQAFLIGWSGRSDPDGNLYNFLHSNTPLNDAKYSNPAVDNALDQARLTSDVVRRRALYATAIGQAEKDLPIIYLYAPKLVFATSSRLRGFVPVPDGLIRPQGIQMTP